MWLETLPRVWQFLLAFFICWCKSQSFVFVQDEFRAVLPFWKFQFTAVRLLFNWLLITFGTWINNYNNRNGSHGWNKSRSGRGLAKFCKINSVVTMLNGMKDFCCLDLKCSFMFCFTSNFHRMCLNLYATFFMV